MRSQIGVRWQLQIVTLWEESPWISMSKNGMMGKPARWLDLGQRRKHWARLKSADFGKRGRSFPLCVEQMRWLTRLRDSTPEQRAQLQLGRDYACCLKISGCGRPDEKRGASNSIRLLRTSKTSLHPFFPLLLFLFFHIVYFQPSSSELRVWYPISIFDAFWYVQTDLPLRCRQLAWMLDIHYVQAVFGGLTWIGFGFPCHIWRASFCATRKADCFTPPVFPFSIHTAFE